jgi:hypothetical protein
MTGSRYEQEAVAVARRVRADVNRLLSAHATGAVVLKAIAGGGKSTFITESVGRFARRTAMVIAAPTNDQVQSLVWSIAAAHPGLDLAYVPAQDVELPFPPPANVRVCRPAAQARGARIVLATLDKVGDALGRGDLDSAGLLIVDEAYQADSGRYYGAAPIAPVHLLVGDPGQVDPFATVEEASRFRGLPEDPIRTAVTVVLDNHPNTPVHRLPITRRLDERALPLVRAFYEPEHEFGAAVPLGIRELTFQPALSRDRRVRDIDAALVAAGQDGLAHLELPAGPALSADPDTVDVIATTVARALEPGRRARMRCERHPGGDMPLTADRVAVGVSHNDQARAVRRALRRRGHGDVRVGTANKLQGAEYDLTVCWHPLAGLTEADAFHVEAGRACVLATRHRHACVIVGRESDRLVLDGLPPSGEAYLGSDDEPLLDGWATHEAMFAALEPFRRPLAA